MASRSDTGFCDLYPDLLADEDGSDRMRLIHDLHAGYTGFAAPPMAPPRSRRTPAGPLRIPGHVLASLSRLGLAREEAHIRDRSRRLHRRLRAPLGAIAAVAVLLAATATVAGPKQPGVTDLGKPTNIQSTNAYFPLSGFRRIPEFPRQDGKPVLVFLGALGAYDRTIAERWPVVKALDQFGRLSNVKAVDTQCSTITSGPYAGLPNCTLATFDFTRARYSSPYVAFASRDLIRPAGIKMRSYQLLNAAEAQLYKKYARPLGKPSCYKTDSSGHVIKDRNGQWETYPCTGFADYVNQAAGDDAQGTRRLPLIAIGGYLQTDSQVLVAGDLSQTIAVTPQPGSSPLYWTRAYSFSAIQAAMIADKDLTPAPNHLVENINAEANVMTALICHADGGKPASVCGRPVIKTMLKLIK
jgi:hypothetical protein